MTRDIRVIHMLSFECTPELQQMVEDLDAVLPRSTYGSRGEWLSYIVATAIEQYKEHGVFFPQDNHDAIDELIDDIGEMQATVDTIEVELEELRQRAHGARSTTPKG